jgi:hypothetical protein
LLSVLRVLLDLHLPQTHPFWMGQPGRQELPAWRALPAQLVHFSQRDEGRDWMLVLQQI